MTLMEMFLAFIKLVILSNFAIQNYYNLYEVYAKVPNTYFLKLGTEYIGENHVFSIKTGKFCICWIFEIMTYTALILIKHIT